LYAHETNQGGGLEVLLNTGYLPTHVAWSDACQTQPSIASV